jgi:predicted AlkP superfamily phosphohydrolase/phosphomutase
LIDPARSRCFVVENNHAHGGIRVNLAGREPNGLVAPGDDLDRFCETLSRELLAIVDLDRGERVVSRVLRTDDLYHGEHRELLPDLLVEWSSYAPISKIRIGSPAIGELAGEYTFCRTGDHFPGGMFVATGPGIAHGVLDRTVSIMDFAPTFCAMLGVDLNDVDGEPIRELVSPVAAVA